MNAESSNCLVQELMEVGKAGNAYVDVQTFFGRCLKKHPSMTYEMFHDMLTEQTRLKTIHREGNDLYLEETWKNEETVAHCLSDILQANPLVTTKLPETMRVGDVTLFDEQRKAVATALSNRLSCIVGGAGSGKSTLIRAIIDQSGISESRCILCAPTGKAAQNLRQKTGVDNARTIQKVLGLCYGGEPLINPNLANARMIIVDESSMMTLELMAKLLNRANEDCQIVMLGDPNQLLGIGAGNVLPDLRRIGIPFSVLGYNHRQSDVNSALYHNVSQFGSLSNASDLRFDDSFVFCESNDFMMCQQITREAARCYRAGRSTKVLTPRKDCSPLAAEELNRRLQKELNPDAPEKASFVRKETVFRDGDPVMITGNDVCRNCFNGDVGSFKKLADGNGFCVRLPDGRTPWWRGKDVEAGLGGLKLAYAVTVYKAQGSEYDTVLAPLPIYGAVLNRNLLYTAISRAKRRVILYGSVETLERVMRTEPPPRASKLVEKTLRLMTRSA